MNIKQKLFPVHKVPNHDFFKRRFICCFVPIVFLIITLVFSLFVGVNVDIKFKGGTIINVPFTGEVNTDNLRGIAKNALGADCTVQQSVGDQSSNIVITLSENKEVSPEKVSSLLEKMKAEYPDNITVANSSDIQLTSVDSQIGADFFGKCLMAVAVAFLAIIIYIGIRFRKIGGLSAAVMGLLALVHDIAFVFATIVFFRFPINDAFMAVILTILGYSINNTIVVYDRIRENRQNMGYDKPIKEVVNLSINQTLSRSINSSLTTVLALCVMLVVGLICRLDSIVAFVLPMIIGIAAGVYSSVFMSGPLWAMWKENHPDKPKNGKSKRSKAKKDEDEEIEVRTSFKISPDNDENKVFKSNGNGNNEVKASFKSGDSNKPKKRKPKK